MLGKFFFGLLIVAVLVLVVTIGFQVFSILKPSPADKLAEAEFRQSALLEEVDTSSASEEIEPGKTAAEIVSEARAAGVRKRAAAEKAAREAIGAVEPSKGDAIGRVEMVIGGASAVGAGGKSRELDIGVPVYLNDTISCAAGSKAKLLLADGTVIWIGESSSMAIDTYVYRPDDKDATDCVLRFMKGVCRVLTGAITSLNPEAFRMKLRMATVGIRGCETGIESDETGDSIYVLALGANETVVVDATVDGTPIMDPLSGRAMQIGERQKKRVEVDQAGVSVTVAVGEGIGTQTLSADDVLNLKRRTSSLPPAQPDVMGKADGAVVVVQPKLQKAARGESPGK